ncbi:MAG: hypothetical protein KAR85_03585 [Methanosarcinales archaeon]|nr:hypothetical protein [Methanosarcinales archaeon]
MPIAMMVRNKDADSSKYDIIKHMPHSILFQTMIPTQC